jgi:hypothetical protein
MNGIDFLNRCVTLWAWKRIVRFPQPLAGVEPMSTPSATVTENPELRFRGIPMLTHEVALSFLERDVFDSVPPSVRASKKFVKAMKLLHDSLLPVMTKIDEMNEECRKEHNRLVMERLDRIKSKNDLALLMMVAGAPIKLGAETPAGA